MTAPKYITKEGEHGPEYWQGDARAFFTNKAGNIQAAHGFAEMREDFDKWLGHQAPAEAVEVVEEPKKAVVKQSAPVGSPELGEKDPAVIAWHFKNDRKAAEVKYANAKHLWPI